MTEAVNISQTLEFSIQQIFAESYWERYLKQKEIYRLNPTTDPVKITERNNELKRLAKNALLRGNSREEDISKGGYAKLTETLADEALLKYEVVDYLENQAAGFSAILLKDISDPLVPKYTLSFRSTEYVPDFFRDGHGADTEIQTNGFAFGQISEMEKYYQKLISENLIPLDSTSATGHKKVNISGYSLGGHLAYAFYTMHPDAVEHVYTQNAAGIGMIGSDTRDQTYYRTQLTNANIHFNNLLQNFYYNVFEIPGRLNSTESLYFKSNLELIFSKIQFNSSTINPAAELVSGLTSGPLKDAAEQIVNIMNLYRIEFKVDLSLLASRNLVDTFKDATRLSLTVPNPAYPSGETLNSTIYTDSRYRLAVQITKVDFNTRGIGIAESFVPSITGGDGGQVVDVLFPPTKFTTISGRASSNPENIINDPNFVSKSNLHSEFTDIFIEDQPEIIGKGGKIPGVAYEYTKNNDGDLGNTHSITALIDSMRAIKTLQILDSNITNSIAQSLLNSTSNQYAKRFVKQNTTDATESNSISNLIDSLYRILRDPTQIDTKFTRLSTALGEVDKRNTVHIRENSLMAYRTESPSNPNPIITIKPFFDSTKNVNEQILSVTELLNKAKQNDNESIFSNLNFKGKSFKEKVNMINDGSPQVWVSRIFVNKVLSPNK